MHRLLPLLALVLAVIPACAASGPGSRRVPPATQPAPPPPPSTAQLIEWALGSDDRAVEPPSPSGRFVLVLPESSPQKGLTSESGAPPAGNPLPEGGTRLTPQCAEISSILPGPLRKLFLLLDGALHVLHAPSARSLRSEESVPLPGPSPLNGDASVRFRRLLGFHTEGSSVRILATAGPGEEQVWLLTIAGPQAATFHAEPLADERKPRTREEFFATYQSPRCQRGGTDCLELGYDGSDYFVQVKPTHGAGSEDLRRLGSTGARDVAWKPGGGLYVLMTCPPQRSPRP